MLFGYPPFHAETDDGIFALVKKGFDPKTRDGYGAHFPKAIPCSDAAKDLMSKLLTLDTAKRITASEALEHPWLTGEKADSKPRIQAVLNNLMGFNAKYKFKQEILRLMSDTLSQTEIDGLKATFQAIDINHDGSITVSEMKQAIEKWGGDDKSKDSEQANNILSLMKMADLDGDGSLSWQELLLTCVQRKLNEKEERLWVAFRKLDLNGDGRVTKEEIEKVLGPKSHAAELIAEADVDGDGTVDYDEFIAMWSAKGTMPLSPTSTTTTLDESKDKKEEKKEEHKEAVKTDK
jgi:calcium-dependent protein kinase